MTRKIQIDMTVPNIVELEEDEYGILIEPKCPKSGCGTGVARPKCMFELGSDCPRHDLAHAYSQERRRRLEEARNKQAEFDEFKKALDALKDATDNLLGPQSLLGPQYLPGVRRTPVLLVGPQTLKRIREHATESQDGREYEGNPAVYMSEVLISLRK